MEKQQIEFENWSTQLPTAAIYQIFEKFTVKDNKAITIYGVRVTLLFSELESENPKALVFPFKPVFSEPDLAFKFIQKNLKTLFTNTAIIAVLVDRNNQSVGGYDLSKEVEEESEVKHPEMITEGTVAVN